MAAKIKKNINSNLFSLDPLDYSVGEKSHPLKLNLWNQRVFLIFNRNSTMLYIKKIFFEAIKWQSLCQVFLH